MPDGSLSMPVLTSTSRPRSRHAHLSGTLLLMAESAGIYELTEQDAAMFEAALNEGDAPTLSALSTLGLDRPALVRETETPGPVLALALTVSQSCNMACGYCYAAGGSFGGPDTTMSFDVARRAIDQLITPCPPGGEVKIAFMGGEPMVARDLIVDAVTYARQRAAVRAVRVGFSMTTNATLLRPGDAAFLARHRFTVTVSLDGDRETNDRLRPMRGGTGSFDRVAARLAPLLAQSTQIGLSARVTVTPGNLDISRTVQALTDLGFGSVGASPMLASPTGTGALAADDFPVLLKAMKATGDDWLKATLAGKPHAFANLATALAEIHRGKPRSHSCGAVRDYLAVDASGNYAACHRFVKDPLGAMGDLEGGIDQNARKGFLDQRHADRQPECQACWAKSLCGGGCHHEVLHSGRPACDYIRGWLDYAMASYQQLIAARPDWFDGR